MQYGKMGAGNPFVRTWPIDAHLVGQPDPPAPPAPGNPPPPAPPPAPGPPAPPEPFATFPDAESFQKRVDREARKRMKDVFGTDDEATIKARLEEQEKLAKAAEEAKRAQMTEIDRLKLEKQEAEARAAAAMSDAEEMRMRSHLHSVFAKKGIKNHEYGFFQVTSALARLGESEQLDEDKFLDGLIADPAHKAALGIEGPPPDPVVRPATTTPVGTPPPAPPPASGAGTPPKSDMALSQEEWLAKKRALGIG